MKPSASAWLLGSLILGFSLVACGEDEDTAETPASGGAAGTGGTAGAAGSTGGAGGCMELHPSDTMLYFGSLASFGVTARVDAPLPGYAKTRLALELYDEGSGLPPGSFDLGKPPEDNYGTCEHCVLLVAYDELGQARRVFFQESGSMTLDELALDQGLVATGSVKDVKLVEVTQELDLSWHEVAGGACFVLPSWSFDTKPVNGGDCDSAEDCPNEALQVCDVETKKCVTGECSLTFDPPLCPEGQLCMSQIGALIERDEGGVATGACYEKCSPKGSNTCGSGQKCFPLGPTQSAGICLASGGPKLGDACEPSDLGTSCADGGYCTGDPPRCQKTCAYLSPPAGCPDATYCSSLNLCEPLSAGDPAPVGTPCQPTSPLLRDCGPEGDMFRGACIDWFPEAATKTCERYCKVADPKCGPGQSCLATFDNPTVGICHDKPTCGDGVLDVIGGELCDDGNTASGDGCGKDCKTQELEALCQQATPLILGVDFSTNVGAPTGFPSLCDPYIANPAKLYSFLPPGPGKLDLVLESSADLGLSVLSDCAAGATELGCHSFPGKDTLHLNFATVPAKPVLVTVRSAYPLATGSFALSAAFVPAVCGDGKVGGAEHCDDGNTTSGDGCSADCTSVEWSNVCSALPVLQLDTKLSGNVDGGTSYFDSSGLCAYQSGRERAWTWTASATGKLQLSLDAASNLDVFVLSECTAVSPEKLAQCANSGQASQTEAMDVAVSAGQKLTVVVQGHSQDDGGAFVLSAKLVP
ncbi:MAG: DUF4215 domain-containing protein [Polyangiaceae bacterium]